MSAYCGKKVYPERSRRVFVAMSGGVDSSVAALLLSGSARSREARKRAGLPADMQDYDVVGVFMRCYNVDGCAERDAEDARRVAGKLDIPFYVWDFEEEYKERVVGYMVEGYRRGETPNPDVMCNKEIKFGIFLGRALTMGADYVATGHYVRLAISHWPLATSDYTLLAARDAQKDQSYFLWTLTQEQLRHCLFPIGDYVKSEVREMAREASLPTAEKKDSQGICFLGKVTLADFLKQYIPEEQGAVLKTTGEKIGEHRGAHFYTIGQRHGLNLGVRCQVSGIRKDFEPYYVAAKDIATNTLVMAEGGDNPALYRKEIELNDVNLIHPVIPDSRFQIPVMARVRYRQPLAPAKFQIQDSRFHLIFDEPQKFVASGQSAVFYSEEGEMLGGGVIVAD